MSQGPTFVVNNPVSGTQYWSPMGYGCIANNGTSVSCTVQAYSGLNGTGSLVAVTTLQATVWDQTTSTGYNFSGGPFNTATSTHTAGNSTDWYKPSAKWTGTQSVGSLIMYLTYTGTAFIPTTPTFSPSFGSPGDSIGLTGTHFTDASSVDFNGVGASFVVNNDTSITATVPAGATTGPIHVANQSGSATSASNFTANSIFGSDGSAFQSGVLVYGDDGAAWQSAVQIHADDGSSWHRIY